MEDREKTKEEYEVQKTTNGVGFSTGVVGKPPKSNRGVTGVENDVVHTQEIYL